MCKSIVLIVCFSIILNTDCQIDVRCSLSLFDTMPVLNIPAFMGNWKRYGYINGRRPELHSANQLNCSQINISNNETHADRLVIKGDSLASSRVGQSVTQGSPINYSVNNLGRPGKWERNYAGAIRSMYLIHTDYEQNALYVTCLHQNGRDDTGFHFLARNHRRPVIVEEYKQLLSVGYGVNVSSYVEIRQDDVSCGVRC